MTQALGLIALGMAAFYGFAFWQDRSLARQTGESGKAYEQQKQRFANLTAELSPEKRDAQLDQDLKSIEAAIALRQSLLGELGTGALAGTTGYSEYLRAFARQTVQGLWLTSIQIAEGGGQLTMSGRALQADLVAVLIAVADTALFEPILQRQKASSQRIQQQQDEIRTMQLQVQGYAQARAGYNANAKRQRLEQRKLELVVLDRELAARQSALVPPERMAKMLSEIVKRNPDIELVSLRSLAASGLTSLTATAAPAPGGLAMYPPGIAIAASESSLHILTYLPHPTPLPPKP